MMMNNDNVESSLLTSSLLKIHSMYKFCYKLHMSSWRSRWTELYSSYIYEVYCRSSEVCWGVTSIYTTSVHWRIQGVLPVHAPPTGSISFVFAYVFAKKCTHPRLVLPQRVSTPPPTGNPGSATECLSQFTRKYDGLLIKSHKSRGGRSRV